METSFAEWARALFAPARSWAVACSAGTHFRPRGSRSPRPPSPRSLPGFLSCSFRYCWHCLARGGCPFGFGSARFWRLPAFIFSPFRLSGLAALNRGDLLILACAFMFALHVISIGHYSIRHSTGALTLIQVAVTTLFTLLCVPLFAWMGVEQPRVVWTRGLVLAVVTTGIFATAVAFSVQVWAQQYTSANHAAIIFTLEPVFAGLTSFVFYHERLGARSLAGAALILGGILIAELLGPAPAAESSVPPAETVERLT